VIELAAAAGLGLALGVVTGLPLGLVNVAVVEAASAGRARFAAQIGAGGALADAVHAAIAFLGVGRVITERTEWTRVLYVIAGAIVVAYAASVWRRRKSIGHGHGHGHGILVGIGLTLPNPGALAAWVAVAAAVWPTISVMGAIVLAACVGVGSAVWFTRLARWTARAKRT
jgi:threonine/homoserine/homoserine lactone efflux protein